MVNFVTRELTCLSDLFDSCDLIVNCSGVGARRLANDSLVVPVRGELRLDGRISRTCLLFCGWEGLKMFKRMDGQAAIEITCHDHSITTWSVQAYIFFREVAFVLVVIDANYFRTTGCDMTLVGIPPCYGARRLNSCKLLHGLSFFRDWYLPKHFYSKVLDT